MSPVQTSTTRYGSLSASSTSSALPRISLCRAALTFGYMTALAYVGALVTYQGACALGWG